MKKPLHMLTGINIGDYEFDHNTIIDVLKKFKFGKENGGVFNWCPIRLDRGKVPSELLYKWAEYFRDNEIYFMFKNGYARGKAVVELVLTKEEIEKVQEIAGEYYIGEAIGEFGGWYSSKAKGYYPRGSAANPVEGLQTCDEAVETYIRQIRKKSDKMRENGNKLINSIEAVATFRYDHDAGIDHMVVEVAPRNMEQIMNFARGTERAYKKNFMGSWLAHEFYGGYHQFDPLKAKRFKAEYYSTYLAGLDYVCLESGFRKICSHVEDIVNQPHSPEEAHLYGEGCLSEEHPLVKSYLKEAEDFAKFCNEDIRPGENGPITKVAFVHGNFDGFAYGNSSSLWGQYYDKKWGFAAPEFSYRILDEVYHSAEWNDGKNFGDYDYSHAPGYGQYDVIPATTPLDVLSQYEWVIFCGWNTMTPEIADAFKKYVEQGGKLFITAAHMRDSVDRAERGNFAAFDWESFLGVKLSDEIVNCNEGYKFVKNSTIDGMMYPGTHTLLCDPAWSAGYTDYVMIEPTTATTVGYLSDSFGRKTLPNGEELIKDFSLMPLITENKVGEGSVIFMASSEYPGAPEIYPLYKMMVKSILAASHRTSDLKVIGSDKFRFAMYEDDEKYKLYILNTDYNMKNFVKVIFKGEEREALVDSVGLEIMEFKK